MAPLAPGLGIGWNRLIMMVLGQIAFILAQKSGHVKEGYTQNSGKKL